MDRKTVERITGMRLTGMRKIHTEIDNPLLTIKVYYDKWNSEYQVIVKGQPEATYYTDCKDDAMSTAKLMCNDGDLGGSE